MNREWTWWDMNGAMVQLVAGVLLALFGLGYCVYKDDQKWQAFIVAHDCKVTRQIAAQVVTGVGTTMINGRIGVGPSTHIIPSQTCWFCDDGVEYCR